MVGLGEHALSKGYKKTFLIAEDYGFPYSQVQGFMASYCAKGGKVVDKAWVPLGTKDYASVIAKIPKDVDALVVVLGGSDAVNFLTQYEQAGGNKPMVGGSITVDQTVLNFKGKRRESLLGTASAGPMADSIDTPEWKKFVADYKATFKDGFPSPSLFAYLYYINTKATLDALDAVKGDLSGDQKAYRDALQKTKLQGPGRRGEDRQQPQRRRGLPTSPKWPRRPTARSTTRWCKSCPTSRRRSACRKRSSRRWAWARAMCPTAASKQPALNDGLDHFAAASRRHVRRCRRLARTGRAAAVRRCAAARAG